MTQEQLLRHVVNVLEQMDVSYMIVGSYATSLYGDPRYTQDIDIVVRLERGDIPVLERAFPEPEYYLSAAAADDAITRSTQFNVIHAGSGNKLDFMIAHRDLWGREQISRRVKRRFLSDLEAHVASPEDLIISKMRYFKEGTSDKHLRDIAGMLKVSNELIDRAYVEKWATHFDLMDIWEAILDRVEGPTARPR